MLWALQQLRRRRVLGRGGLRLRQPGDDDLGAGLAGRQVRVRGRPRHRAAPLLRAPQGPPHEHELGRLDLRLDRRHPEARGAGRHAGGDRLRGESREGRHRLHRGRHRHQGPRAAHGPPAGRPPEHRGVHRRGRRQAQAH
ncbi:MAG: hypothetical protein MZV70_75745 [Desulfobacterales bacterium]|nr:hypothetical protein [Desulfobacterales bacterium]